MQFHIISSLSGRHVYARRRKLSKLNCFQNKLFSRKISFEALQLEQLVNLHLKILATEKFSPRLILILKLMMSIS